MNKPESTASKTIDYYNSHYKHISDGFDSAKYKEEVFRQFGKYLNKNNRILDVGSGVGYFLNALEENGFKHIFGVEIDKNQYLESIKRLKIANVVNEDVLAFSDDIKFDVIFLTDLIEHISKIEVINLLKKLNNLLAENGVLIIRTPNANSVYSTRMIFNDFTHETAYNDNSIKMILREAGFDNIKCEAVKYKSSLISSPIRFIGNCIIKIYLFDYFGRTALKFILSPDFITVARK